MIFVTGGTGLVGSHILLEITKQKIPVRALKRISSSKIVCEKVFNYYKQSHLLKEIEWIDGDINDIISIEEAINGCNYVIHAAAIISFNPDDVKEMLNVNIKGTANVVNACLDSNIKKIAYISSIAALGRNTSKGIVNENCIFQMNKLETNYSISKYHAELELWRGAAEGLETVILNPSVILGAGDWSKGSSQIFEKSFKGIKYYSEGGTGYVDVIDVAKCAVMLLHSDIKNERFIINSENIKYRDIFDTLSEKFNKPKPKIKVTTLMKEIAWRIEYVKSLFLDINPRITRETANMAMSRSEYSNNKLQKYLDYKFIPISESLENYANWFLSER
ncbi:MAG: nucleoside-diphosphate sugar epimerase [Flavobacteriales bacterium]|nr:nucleoside-diphosphate sugar epimerase [Flavobacteriales bacterium]